MKKSILSFLCFASLFLTSCATAITTAKNVEPFTLETSNANVQMDFIGYKIDSNILSTTSSIQTGVGTWTRKIETVMSEYDQARAISQTDSLRKLGYTLENASIATNKSSTYFGIYSLQELDLYKSSHRYVTFVEVAQNQLNYKDNSSEQNLWGGISGGLLGGGAVWLLCGAIFSNDDYLKDLTSTYLIGGGVISGVGLLAAIPALSPSKTQTTFSGAYNIYVYDTEKKALIKKDLVSVNASETFEGSYNFDDTSKEVVRNYYSKIIANELLKKYKEIDTWLTTQN